MLPFLGMLGKVGMVTSTVASFAGGAQERAGIRAQAAARGQLAEQQRAAAEFEADQLETNAVQSVAASQRRALEERRLATRVASRALALAAASGAGASDPTVINMIAATSGEGAYRAAVSMWEGEDKARRMRDEAKVARYTGESRARLSESEADSLEIRESSMRTRDYLSLAGGLAGSSKSLIGR